MSYRVLVCGGHGQLGRELQASVPAGWSCLAPGREQLDITVAGSTADVLDELQPDIVVNAAAYTAVDRAESEPELAHKINAEGASQLAGACADADIRLIHVSTDFVFDGRASTPYGPEAICNPLGAYGHSKLGGEQGVQEQLPGSAIIRTSWLYSRFGANFVKTMLRLMTEPDKLTVVHDQVGSPTWAAGLARAIWTMAERPQLSGIYHWSDDGQCSWFEFAQAIQSEAHALGILERTIDIEPIPGSDYPTPAQRPAYSVLNSDRSAHDLDLTPVAWRQQLRNMLADLQEHEND